MSKSIIKYQPDYNVLPGTDDYYIERDKFVRLAYITYCIEREWDNRSLEEIRRFAFSEHFYNGYYVFESAIRNWQWHFYYRVKNTSLRTINLIS